MQGQAHTIFPSENTNVMRVFYTYPADRPGYIFDVKYYVRICGYAGILCLPVGSGWERRLGASTNNFGTG